MAFSPQDAAGRQAPAAPRARYALLDELRGLNLISMIGYHAMWDYVYLLGAPSSVALWYMGWQGVLWQQCICWIFILLSGFCVPFGRHTLRRGGEVFAAGALVTAVTVLVVPEVAVWFGVLTLLGSAMLLTGLLAPVLRRIPPAAGAAVCALLFALSYHISAGYLGLGPWRLALPRGLYANYLTAYLGFCPQGFFSTDYFPLLPWVFLFWAGYFLHALVGRARMEPLRRSVCPPLGWVGRHSLLIYLLHQPALYALAYGVSYLRLIL